MKNSEKSVRDIHVDMDGFLLKDEKWDEGIARALAAKEGVTLSPKKMAIIRFMRKHYEKFASFPILSAICKKVHQKRECVYEEFVNPMKAWKIAGLPKPPGIFFNKFHDKDFRPNPFY